MRLASFDTEALPIAKHMLSPPNTKETFYRPFKASQEEEASTAKGRFPCSWILLPSYILLWVAFYLLAHWTARNSPFAADISPTVLILLVEFIKLLIASGLFIAKQRPHVRLLPFRRTLFVSYFPIAVFYAAYNNLLVINLVYFDDPLSYVVLSSSTRLLMIALVGRCVYGRRALSVLHYTSLALLIVAVLLNEVWPRLTNDSVETAALSSYSFQVLLVMAQMLFSVLGAVYNEKLVNNGAGMIVQHPLLHNICLYSSSIVLHACIVLIMVPSFRDVQDMLATIVSSVPLLAMTLTLAAVGILTSLILRHVGAVTKAAASAMETAIMAMIGYFAFGYEIPPYCALSIAFVLMGGHLYYCAQEANKAMNISPRAGHEQEQNDGTSTQECKSDFVYRRKKLRMVLLRLLFFIALLSLINTIAFVSHSDYHPEKISPQAMPQGLDARNGRDRVQTMPSCENAQHSARDVDPGNKKWNAFQAAVKVFQKLDADYFVTAGTLLGFVRECRLFDYDVDFALSLDWLKQPGNEDRLVGAFEHSGFQLLYRMGGTHDTVTSLGGEFAFVLNDVKVDVFMVVRSASFYVNGVSNDTHLFACPKPMSYIQEFTWRNLTVRVPMPYRDVLLTTYGDDYMVPRWTSFLSNIRRAAEMGRCMVARVRGNQSDRGKSGILACLTDRQSVAHALALVQSMSQWDHPAVLELYHRGTLSYFLQAQLESYPFVTLVDISQRLLLNQSLHSYESLPSLETAAVRITKLRHVLLVRPSIVFLQEPLYLLRTAQYSQERKEDCMSCGRGPCVTTTDWEMTQNLEAHDEASEVLCMVRTALNYSIPSIMLKRTSQHVASLHEVSHGLAVWAYPSKHNLQWIAHHIDMEEESFVLNTTRDGTLTLPQDYYNSLQSYWHAYLDAGRLLLMDRPIKWVAFDGGMHLEGGPLNSLAAAKKSHKLGASILNVDVAYSVDRELVVIHNDRMFTPFDFAANRLAKSISSMKASEAQQLINPCLPEALVRSWLDGNEYHNYSCVPETVSLAMDLIDAVPGAELIFDLKAPTEELQLEQARALVEVVNKTSGGEGRRKRISVRFFSSTMDKDLVASIIPDRALESLASDPTISKLSYYVNVPSALACSQITSWIQNKSDFENKEIAGCFVVMNHARIAESWNLFVQAHAVPLNIDMHVSQHQKAICDVPRKQREPDIRLWREGFISCVAEGFDLVHHPFHVPVASDFEVLPMLEAVPGFEKEVFQTIQSHLTAAMKDKIWYQYSSHWGYASPSDWSRRQDWWFQGNKKMLSAPSEVAGEGAIFRCVSKVLVVMLFLRLEELGVLKLDDIVVAEERVYNVTWRHIFSNTAGSDGSKAGTEFDYSNGLWKYVPDSVHSATGMYFLDAMQHYILDPMGITGSFDTNTAYPPYAARGFVGSLDDLLLIGSTLAGRGVSTKTRKQVVSARSVEALLQDSVALGNTTNSFSRHEVVKSMKRFHEPSSSLESDFPRGVVDGYGLGIWRVGWRSSAEGPQVRGWLCMGSSEALLYFDMTGLVVAMHSTRRLRYELTAPFAHVIRDLGSHILESLSLM